MEQISDIRFQEKQRHFAAGSEQLAVKD